MWIKRKKVDTMMNTNSKLQKLDEKTKIGAELAAKILTGIPSDKEPIFLAVINAYMDGLVAGQELKEIG